MCFSPEEMSYPANAWRCMSMRGNTCKTKIFKTQDMQDMTEKTGNGKDEKVKGNKIKFKTSFLIQNAKKKLSKHHTTHLRKERKAAPP